MLRSRLVLINVLMALAVTGCSRSNQNSPGASSTASPSPAAVGRITSESVVKVAIQGAELSPGGFADAIVRVTVQNGYHINSNPPTFPYLKATELEMADTDEISLNNIYYPKPLVKTFAFSDKPLQVYEGETQLTVALQAAKNAKKGQQSIPAKLSIQACDDQVCYPPGSIDVAIPVLIK
ncbi:MAG: protein-disulfide reductase DsbD N-terminal domain-containing protein [Pyrinomonadaceae bacterium]|nr:protein-disulfide reductase DsbD N-terminal domain-containing protein [Pyrinomonadaceae bacterium]